MKIVFLLPSYAWKPSGGFRVVYELSNRLVRRGHDVAVVHPRRLPNWEPRVRGAAVRARRLVNALKETLFRPSLKWHPLDPKVRRLHISRLSEDALPAADAVCATFWATAEIMKDFSPQAGKKFYLIQHYEIWGGPKARVDATWRAPFKKIVIARWLYETALDMGIPAADLAYIPYGMDHSLYRIHRPIESRPKRVAMMYLPSEWKGGPDGIRALETARDTVPDMQAVIFGIGRRPAGLPAWITYRKNPAQREIVEEIYNGSRVFLCPSWTEGWFLPNTEAMACGCAVASTDCGGVREYGEDGLTALLSPPRRPDLLAANLVRLLQDDSLRIRIAQAGRDRVRRFSWDQAADRLEHFLLSGS
jgi:L-malate glycosyltransferase